MLWYNIQWQNNWIHRAGIFSLESSALFACSKTNYWWAMSKHCPPSNLSACLWLLPRSFNWTLWRITQAGGVEEETRLHISPSPSALCSLILYTDAGILGEILTGIWFLSLNLDVGFGYTLFLHSYMWNNIDVTAQIYTVRHVEASRQSQVAQHRVSFKIWCHTKSEHGQASSISCHVEAEQRQTPLWKWIDRAICIPIEVGAGGGWGGRPSSEK